MEAQLERPSQEENHERDVSYSDRDPPFITGTNLPMQTGFDLEKPVFSPDDDLRDTNVKEPELGTKRVPKSKNIPSLAKPDVMDLEQEHAIQDPNVRIGKLEDLEEDPQSPRRGIAPSNYQTKVVDPTGQGGEEAEIGSLIQGLKDAPVTTTYDKDGASKKGLDKGVSVKDYIAEKLRPGNEDKALSEAIAEKLCIKKNTVEDENESETTGVLVGRLKGVVGSWLGNKSSEKTTEMDRDVVPTHRE